MGMSTHVTALRSKDSEEYQKHAKVLRACIDAEIMKLPEETAKFFDSEDPEEYLLTEKLELEINYIDYHGDCESGIEVKISDIPESCEVLRFYNSH
jgi:hypothetical protein